MATNNQSAKCGITAVLATIFLATPVLAMDDQATYWQATYWRFDGRVEKRPTSVAPATAWAASARIGDDSTRFRLQNSGAIDDSATSTTRRQGHRQPLLLQPDPGRLGCIRGTRHTFHMIPIGPISNSSAAFFCSSLSDV